MAVIYSERLAKCFGRYCFAKKVFDVIAVLVKVFGLQGIFAQYLNNSAFSREKILICREKHVLEKVNTFQKCSIILISGRH